MKSSFLDSAASVRRLLAVLAMLFGVTVAGQAGAIPTPCADTGPNVNLAPECFKEVRIINNTETPIYVVLQGSIITQAAINCAVGDVWLQRALGITNKCLPVTHDYYIYINPGAGIKKGATASLKLPWWSKRPAGSDDEYVDWWRSGRLYIFDDPKALADIYDKVKNTPQLKLATGSPAPQCMPGNGGVCTGVKIWQVPDGGEFGTQTPAQLNEYTFASVDPPSQDPATDYRLVNLNQNYNVSNVDQAYLPLAMEPIRPQPDIGYMGTTTPLKTFRDNLALFTGVDVNGKNPTKWPVYNIPVVAGKKIYPLAGIRVPSAETVLNFYMNPYFFGKYYGGDLGPDNIPQLLPFNPANPTPPADVTALLARWQDCLKTTPASCPTSGKVDWSTFYKGLYKVFLDSYDKYLTYIAESKCKPEPAYLKPQPSSNPQVPANKYALLRYVYGWVPFNVDCDAAVLPSLDLPTVANKNKTPISYVQQQYDFTIKPQLPLSQVFNPYTPMVHNATTDPYLKGLDSNAYAFSIDDVTAFQTNSGSGLIFAVGGDTGLPNKTKVLPTVPPPYQLWDVGVFLGPQGTSNTHWANYGICSSVANMPFPAVSTDTGFAIGVDPAISNFPCLVTLKDSGGQTYKFTLSSKTQTPPKPIWPAWPVGKQGYDNSVVTCVTSSAQQWCQFVNETAIPTGQKDGPSYGLSARGPLPK